MNDRLHLVFKVERLDLKPLASSRAGFSPPPVSSPMGGLKSALLRAVEFP